MHPPQQSSLPHTDEAVQVVSLDKQKLLHMISITGTNSQTTTATALRGAGKREKGEFERNRDINSNVARGEGMTRAKKCGRV